MAVVKLPEAVDTEDKIMLDQIETKNNAAGSAMRKAFYAGSTNSSGQAIRLKAWNALDYTTQLAWAAAAQAARRAPSESQLELSYRVYREYVEVLSDGFGVEEWEHCKDQGEFLGMWRAGVDASLVLCTEGINSKEAI